jgi:PAS domain S-box-containing protein
VLPAEDAARLFAAVFERAAVGLAVQDPSGRYLAVNPAYERLVGRTADDLRGTTWQAITHPDDVGPGEELARAAARADDVRGFEYRKRYVRPDGTVVWAHIGVTLVADEEGRPLYQLVIAHDVTAVVEEEARRKEFLRSVAHDLRTPLTAVLGAASAIQEFRETAGPEACGDLLRLIVENARRMRDAIERLLASAWDG